MAGEEAHRARRHQRADHAPNNWTLGAYCAQYCRFVTGHHGGGPVGVPTSPQRPRPRRGPRPAGGGARHPRRARTARRALVGLVSGASGRPSCSGWLTAINDARRTCLRGVELDARPPGSHEGCRGASLATTGREVRSRCFPHLRPTAPLAALRPATWSVERLSSCRARRAHPRRSSSTRVAPRRSGSWPCAGTTRDGRLRATSQLARGRSLRPLVEAGASPSTATLNDRETPRDCAVPTRRDAVRPAAAAQPVRPRCRWSDAGSAVGVVVHLRGADLAEPARAARR